MLKKIFYFGVGLASLLYEHFDELARTGEDRYNKFVRVNHPLEETIEIESDISEGQHAQAINKSAEEQEPDDLTKINGIGPTFASRLQKAGITTYKALAGLSIEQVKEITGVAEWQADPGDWISAAEAMD